jgi:fructokinase
VSTTVAAGSPGDFRIGIDVGGTKMEVAALGPAGESLHRHRLPTPKDYGEALATLRKLVTETEAMIGGRASVGVGVPGRIEPHTGLVRCSNCLDGHPIRRDFADALEREVRVANDAVCFTLSEATDGAARGAQVVFGVILGTGCGGGMVVGGRAVDGPNGVAGEWGHNPTPWSEPGEPPGRRCWCGRDGCLEMVLAGPALAFDCDGPGSRDASGIPARAAAGEAKAQAALERHAVRLSRALGWVINVIDPDVIVLGGGLSNMEHLYRRVPELLGADVFGGRCVTPIRRAAHGDSSGVRGAAWLWPATAPAS